MNKEIAQIAKEQGFETYEKASNYVYRGTRHWNPVEGGEKIPGIESVEFALEPDRNVYIFTLTKKTDEAIERLALLRSVGGHVIYVGDPAEDLSGVGIVRPFKRDQPEGRMFYFRERFEGPDFDFDFHASMSFQQRAAEAREEAFSIEDDIFSHLMIMKQSAPGWEEAQSHCRINKG